MNFEYFFAKRITFRAHRKATSLVVRLSVISIALAVATMEIAISFVRGFENEIENKVVGFGSHIVIGNYYRELDTEAIPLNAQDTSLVNILQLEEVTSVHPYV
ncbi:MAG: ABC transporter permease, partial [Bacteroidota bacterium]